MARFAWPVVTFLLLVLCLIDSLVAEEPPADLRVLVFEQGRPAPGVRVEVGGLTGLTDADGVWQARVEPGRSRLAIYRHALALAFLPVNLQAGETAQYIFTLAGDGRSASVSVESSHGDGPAAMPQPAELPANESDRGVLAGRIVSSEDGSPVAGARIYLSGTPVEARSDGDGRFSIEVPSGTYAVSVLHSAHATRTVEDVVIGSDSETRRDFELPPAGLELAEYVVIEPYISGSISSVISEQRETASVANVIGSEQFSRSGDGDAGSALARVTGLTLVGGEFIYVRGLGERYSSTMLNGANVPSPDPTRKVVPLNLFPTGVIDSIRVQKGYSPDMPGDFGGGAVEIRTRGIPEEDFLSIGVSIGARQGTTFDEGLSYRGGGTDWLGRDDGTRGLPDEIAEVIADGQQLRPANPFFPEGLSPEELELLGESFPVIYDVQRQRAGPDLGLSLEGGKLFRFSDEWSAGFTSAVMWSDAYDTRSEERRSFTPLGDGSLKPNDDYTIERSTRDIELSGFLTAGVGFREEHSLELTSMILRQTEDETSIQEGFNLDEDGIIRITELEWEERELVSHQLRGRHRFPILNDLQLEWDYARSRARRDVPDQRRYRYDPDNVADFIFSRRADNNVRRFSWLTDRATDQGLDLSIPFGRDRFRGALSTGLRMLEKDRDSSIRRFQFGGVNTLTPEQRRADSLEDIFNADLIGPGGIVLSESTRATDNYTASLDVDAWYLNLDATLFDRLRLNTGFRREDWRQNVTTFELFNPAAPPIVSELDSRDRMPAHSLTWYLSDRQQLRSAYAETIVRPDFKELSPAPFTDPVLNREVIGNSALIPSDVQHYDLRWELYPDQGELVSIGGFYKRIRNPIEMTVEAGVEQRLSFANAAEADNYGIELEWRKGLGFMSRIVGNRSTWDRLEFSGNLALIESEITIDELGILTSSSRPLQGQSPYVANLQLTYDDDGRDWSATLLLNAVGERIAEVGVLGAPDKKEQPSPDLDLVLQWRWLDLFDVKARFGNLLDSSFEVTQGDEIVQRYQRGRTFSLGLSWRL